MIVLADQHHPLGAIARVAHRYIIAHRRIRRFLDEHVLARGQRLERQVEVELRRYRDHHRVHFRIVDGVGVVGVAAGAAELTAERGSLRLVAAGVAADDLALEPPQVTAVHARDEAAAEKGYVQRLGQDESIIHLEIWRSRDLVICNW
jgi:hypothetical protein